MTSFLSQRRNSLIQHSSKFPNQKSGYGIPDYTDRAVHLALPLDSNPLHEYEKQPGCQLSRIYREV